MLSRPLPPAIPVVWVEAVSEPLVPPEPPKVKQALEQLGGRTGLPTEAPKNVFERLRESLGI